MTKSNDVLTALNLLDRVALRFHGDSRETIKRIQLKQIRQSLTMVLKLLTEYCKDVHVLTPIMEIITLIDNLMTDETFVETDENTKKLMVDRINEASRCLYLFTGKFYMTNEFEWSLTLTDVLRRVVDTCIINGFYFGYDEQLQNEGLI